MGNKSTLQSKISLRVTHVNEHTTTYWNRARYGDITDIQIPNAAPSLSKENQKCKFESKVLMESVDCTHYYK
jgi:hypothetical protein